MDSHLPDAQVSAERLDELIYGFSELWWIADLDDREQYELYAPLKSALRELKALREQCDRQRKALERIAALDDKRANLLFDEYGSYSSFDEPGSVKIARECLQSSASGSNKP